ncbi:MAG: hypothetical protein U0166_21745 [Acidobacteriota bacterium]
MASSTRLACIVSLIALPAFAATPDTAPPPPGIGGERLYVGTGEYNAAQDWHAILRIEGAHLVNGSVTPQGTVNVKQCKDGSNVRLNFVHTIYVDESRNEMYVGALFTTSDNHNCGGPYETCGSIGVLSNASGLNGPQTLSRHIFGPNTLLDQPHGIWIDRSRNMMYVANTFGGNILVWNNANTVNGNTAPSRVIGMGQLGAPVHVYVDPAADRLFAVTMPFGGGKASVVIYNNASTLTGQPTPSVRITGPLCRLEAGNNKTTHNVWYSKQRKLLFVAHHTNEVLIYDLASVNLNPPAPVDIDLAPRVLKINEQDGVDDYGWSAYGLYYLQGPDRLYVSAGYTPNGTPTQSGPPQPGSPKNAVKVYDGISDPSKSGVVPPTRIIYWTNGGQYFPSQPLWISTTGGITGFE